MNAITKNSAFQSDPLVAPVQLKSLLNQRWSVQLPILRCQIFNLRKTRLWHARLACLLVATFSLIPCPAWSRPTASDAAKYTRWSFPIAVSSSASAELHAVAQDVANLLGQPSLLEVPTNPICCFWVQIDSWQPNPHTPGYVIIVQDGGAVLTASNIEQARLAVTALRRIARVSKGQVSLPRVALMTNLPVFH